MQRPLSYIQDSSRSRNESRMIDMGDEDDEDGIVRHGSTRAAAKMKAKTTVTVLHTADNKAFFIRVLALLCTCSLSVGSHYAQYILAPLKSRFLRDFGTSNTEFSLLISAFTLNSTWTPLLGGIMASKLGTTVTSIYATSAILLGTILLLLGDISEDVRLMVLGMFVFGLGISPLSVVQETIIVRFFRSHGLGVSMALGLLAGKSASFISARTSFALTHTFGPCAPFYVAVLLASFSVVVNLIYIIASKWLVDSADAELEATDIIDEAHRSSYSSSEAHALEEVAERRKVHFKDISRLGNIFWAYVGINVLGGTLWTPFTHLASNIIETRYGMTEWDASRQASYLLAGSLVFYPACGYLIDHSKNRPIIMQLFILSSVLTLCCYIWLALPPEWTQTAFPAVLAFGSGYGFAPLVVVLLAPYIVPVKYVSTALGVHKSLEQTGSTIFQTFAGLSLDISGENDMDTAPRNNTRIQYLLNTFVVLNLVQVVAVLGMAHLDKLRKKIPNDDDSINRRFLNRSLSTATIKSPSVGGESQSLLLPRDKSSPSTVPYPDYSATTNHSSSVSEEKNDGWDSGQVFMYVCGGLVVFAWVLFFGTAWMRLRSKGDRGH